MNTELNRSLYRETVQQSGVGDGKVIRQRNSIGVYAHVRAQIRPLNRGEGTIFAWNAGLNIPAKFVHAVSQGIQHAMTLGTSTGFELTDVLLSVEDGSYHEEDSTANAFREAAEKATREAILQAGPIVLEALSSVTITVPEDFVAAAEASISSHEGRVRATPASEIESRTLEAILSSSNLNDLIAELLQISGRRARISSCNAGFRPRLEPPNDEEQWVVRA
jgi:elongation factor G